VSTFNAFYIRKQATDDETRSAILRLYPKAAVLDFTNFLGGILSSGDIEPPEDKLSALSAQLATDVIWIGYSTVTESFLFHHWRTGSVLRVLYYGCAKEGTWDRVEGQPEPWECEYFWDEESLESQLESAKTDDERQELRKLWKDGLIIKGETIPSAGSDVAGEAVMSHYGLFSESDYHPPNSDWVPVTNKDRFGCLFVLILLVFACVLASHYGHLLALLTAIFVLVIGFHVYKRIFK
jgi:hypothetical protein